MARFGGEEFAILLPGMDEAQAAAVAEEARRSVEALRYSHSDSPVNVYDQCGRGDGHRGVDKTAHAFIGAADEALYAAKRQGRNRVGMSTSVGFRENFAVARDLRRMRDTREVPQVAAGLSGAECPEVLSVPRS